MLTCSIVPYLPNTSETLGAMINILSLPNLLAVFVHDQLNSEDPINAREFAPAAFYIHSPVTVYLSAIAIFFVLSDNSSIESMRYECIWATET